jgi:hypothetical protein
LDVIEIDDVLVGGWAVEVRVFAVPRIVTCQASVRV